VNEGTNDAGPWGTVYVLEDPPPATRPRWYVHWEGDEGPGFDDVDRAVEWGLARARSVVVRTLDTVFYWAGERPEDYEEGEILPWPPSERERRRIDVAYEAALAAELGEQDSRATYERERREWLGSHAPAFASRDPMHTCIVLLPESEDVIELEEFDAEGVLCGARRYGGGQTAFGRTDEVVATVSRRAIDDPWVSAVCAALTRERTWTSTGRRSMLLVKKGEGEMFHATATSNRESIEEHGLDWRRMGDVTGIAGSIQPELPAIFLCDTRDEVTFFTDMSREPTDVWAVRVDGFWLEGDPGASGGGDSSWMIVSEPITPERLELVQTDIRSGRHG
jgi:hypothetical protein